MNETDTTSEGAWFLVPQAAKVLRITESAVRYRINPKEGRQARHPSRRLAGSNSNEWEVWLTPADVAGISSPQTSTDIDEDEVGTPTDDPNTKQVSISEYQKILEENTSLRYTLDFVNGQLIQAQRELGEQTGIQKLLATADPEEPRRREALLEERATKIAVLETREQALAEELNRRESQAERVRTDQEAALRLAITSKDEVIGILKSQLSVNAQVPKHSTGFSTLMTTTSVLISASIAVAAVAYALAR
ncbi:MAG: hypothetical protein EXR45_08950 [Chloroflexi bacterium]|nr:hypothetical protein [Chloroflexota bacterium]